MLDGVDRGPAFYFAISAFVLAGVSWCQKCWNNRSHLPLPPGPPCLPIVGSLFSLSDPVRSWLSFNAWRSTYGDIIYVRLLSKRIVVVNSEEIAKDIFEGRSSIYSDKPQSIVYEPFATDFNTAILPYGDRWRLHRRILHQPLRQVAIPTYHAAMLLSAHKMLFSFLQDPTNYPGHFEMFISSIILSVVYDYEPKAKDDRMIRVMQRYLEAVVAGVTPEGTVIMETFPFLLWLPTWFPGATFKRASVECLKSGHDAKEIPFQDVKNRMSTGQVSPCLVADNLNRMNGFDDISENAVKEAACIAFAAASETTFSTLFVFLLAMVLHPEVQVKAQADIDRVVGKDRLPDFDDRPALPYLDAILRETLRWYPAAPLGVPHATTTDDVYKGYFIPKGVVVIANTWAMTHDEKKYPNPDEFKPERFLHEDGSLTNDTMPLGFGWGRRMCVGRHLADATLWSAIASFLATFSVHRALDEHGEEIPVVPKFSTGLAIHPETFPCRIIPRFQSAETLVGLTGLVAEKS
ncbi:cytochrome P450 [Rhizopogon vinicolor AM-OR11-026]|uniref:Cytochrome P450 n=1 Tax=Rhizopogon vinicolor AM-OR11-026 TaxID=1314800 RepID=A0A1B7N4I3_9AGAM|nr:cytochrome P450 [Rhizopogon vinicolor AM-OR11-026]